MDSRAQLEEWFYSDYNEDLHAKLVIEFAKSIAWEAWQASRAAIEVELPAYRDATTHGFSAFNDALDILETELRKHGISIKGESS